jgi:hypothetical protein
MSTLATTNIKHASSSSNNIVLGSDGSAYMPGHIVQVVATNLTATSSVSISTTWADTPLTANITPTYATSKILVSSTIFSELTYAPYYQRFRYSRAISGGSTTNITAPTDGSRSSMMGTGVEGWAGGGDSNRGSTPTQTSFTNYLDSPNTTSEVTYTLQAAAAQGTLTMYINRSAGATDSAAYENGLSWITLMEVAA